MHKNNAAVYEVFPHAPNMGSAFGRAYLGDITEYLKTANAQNSAVNDENFGSETDRLNFDRRQDFSELVISKLEEGKISRAIDMLLTRLESLPNDQASALLESVLEKALDNKETDFVSLLGNISGLTDLLDDEGNEPQISEDVVKAQDYQKNKYAMQRVREENALAPVPFLGSGIA